MSNITTTGRTISSSLILQRVNEENAQLLAPVMAYCLFLMLLGTVGNPLAIYIYGWKWHNSTSRVFLFFLAWMDLINCLVTIPTEVYVMSHLYYFPNGNFCRMSRFVTYFINNTTSAVFLAIAVDRYIRICHPHHRAISIRGAKVACVISMCIGAGVSWPALVLYGRKNIPLPIGGTYIYGAICEVKNEFDDTPYPLAFFVYLCVAVCACVLILAGFYIPIGRVMLQRRRANKRRKKKSREMEEMAAQGSCALLQHKQNNNTEAGNGGGGGGGKGGIASGNGGVSGSSAGGCRETCRQNNLQTQADANGEVSVTMVSAVDDYPSSETPQCLKAIHSARNSIRHGRIRPPKSTLMLSAITAVFVCSFLPFLVIMIIRRHRGATFYPSLSPVEQILVNVFARSYLVNNCTNPIVYGMCNSQFRYQVRRLFRVTSHRRDSSLSRGESRPPAAEGAWSPSATASGGRDVINLTASSGDARSGRYGEASVVSGGSGGDAVNTNGGRCGEVIAASAGSSKDASNAKSAGSGVGGSCSDNGNNAANSNDDGSSSGGGCSTGVGDAGYTNGGIACGGLDNPLSVGSEESDALLGKSQNGVEKNSDFKDKPTKLGFKDKDIIVLHDLPYCGPTSDL